MCFHIKLIENTVNKRVKGMHHYDHNKLHIFSQYLFDFIFNPRHVLSTDMNHDFTETSQITQQGKMPFKDVK